MTGRFTELGAAAIAWALLVVLIGAGFWDIWVLTCTHERRTVSQVVWDLSSRWPILPFMVGLLCGHLFFQRPRS